MGISGNTLPRGDRSRVRAPIRLVVMLPALVSQRAEPGGKWLRPLTRLAPVGSGEPLGRQWQWQWQRQVRATGSAAHDNDEGTYM